MAGTGTGIDYGKAIGAVGDLFSGAGSYFAGQGKIAGDTAMAGGYTEEAASFTDAANIEAQNVKYAKLSGDLQNIAATRNIYKSESGTSSDVAGAGLAESGSALDILRGSAAQGALTHAVIGNQTAINENSYKQQEDAYQGEASMATAEASAATASASAAGTSGTMSSIGSALGAVAGIASMFA